MGHLGLGRLRPVVLMACGAIGCAHGRSPVTAAAPAAPDLMAAACAKLDARAAVVARYQELEMLSGDNPARAQIRYQLGLAYYCLGLYAETLATFDPDMPALATPTGIGRDLDSVIAGGDAKEGTRTGDAPTLRLLVALHRRFPHWRGAENAVAAWAPASYDVPVLADVRDELLYMAGRSAYWAGAFPRARDRFGKVRVTSAVYVPAKLLEGATHVREYAAKPAVAAFVEALRASDVGASPDVDRHRDLAVISLARTFYSSGQFELAAKYYGRIPRESRYWRERLFESGWTEYMRENYPAALAGVGALRAAGGVAPELLCEATLLEFATEEAAGDEQRAAGVYASFQATCPTLFMEIKNFLAANPDDGALYARFAAVLAGKSDLPPAIADVARRLLADTALGRRFDDVDELTREVARYEGLEFPGAGDEGVRVAKLVSDDLRARLAAAMTGAGALARLRMKRLTEELAQQIKRSIHIDYEPLIGLDR